MPNRAHGRILWEIIDTLGIKFDLQPIEYNLENTERWDEITLMTNVIA